VCKISAEVKVSVYRATKNVVSAASLPDMPVETPLFGRDRCCSLKISCKFKKLMKTVELYSK
jgi:hypothetical protein